MPEFIARRFDPLLVGMNGPASELHLDRCEIIGARNMKHAAQEAALYFDDCIKLPIADRGDGEVYLEIEDEQKNKARFHVTCSVHAKYLAKVIP